MSKYFFGTICGRWGLCSPTPRKNGLPAPLAPTPVREKLLMVSTPNVAILPSGCSRSVMCWRGEEEGSETLPPGQGSTASWTQSELMPTVVSVCGKYLRETALHVARNNCDTRRVARRNAQGEMRARERPGLRVVALPVGEVAHRAVVERGRVHPGVAVAGVRPLVAALQTFARATA